MLSEKIRKRRLELGLSVSQVASMIGLTRQTVNSWENGNISSLKVDNLFNLCNALLITPNDLFEISNEKNGIETKIYNLVSKMSFDDKINVYEYITKTLKIGS